MSSWFSRKKDEAAPPLPASLTAQGYNAQPAAGAAQNAAVAALQENFVAYTEQVNGVSAACWEKCITKKAQADMTIGETACVDRCVLKWLASINKVAEVFQAQMQQQQAQQPQQ